MYCVHRKNQPRITKDIYYKCGCIINLNEWNEHSNLNFCNKHFESIVKIVTIENYIERP